MKDLFGQPTEPPKGKSKNDILKKRFKYRVGDIKRNCENCSHRIGTDCSILGQITIKHTCIKWKK